MSSFANSQKTKFLDSIPKSSIGSENDLLTAKCKFNFAYFSVQPKSQSFEKWTALQKEELFAKLKFYSNESLQYWQTMPIGRGSGKVLSIYGKFPSPSDLTHPAHVPHEAQWGRFRLDCSARLIGFVLPTEYNDTIHPKTRKRFDCNTFYIVFLDAEHRFYKGKEKK